MVNEPLLAGACRSAHYDLGSERAYHLAIVAGPDVTAWVARDAERIVAMAWSAGDAALRHADLPRHPRSVTYVSLPEWSTLVPDGALTPGTDEAHLRLVHGRIPHNTVREEPVATLGAQCLYVHEAATEAAVLARFPNARSLPLQAILVNGVRSHPHAHGTLLLHRGAERLDVVVADKDRILLSTSYPARTAEDVLYFCLHAVERIDLDPDHVAVRSGGTHLTAADRALLDRYFADHASAVHTELTSGLIGDHEADRWLAAIDQATCVS